MTERLLVALDIDGTVLLEDGEIRQAVLDEIARVRDAGHEVMLATGRSVAMTLPVLDRLELRSTYVVCSNGAITLRRDPDASTGYRREYVETFDPREVLTSIRARLDAANYAVEHPSGRYLTSGWFPDGSLGASSEHVPFEQLLVSRATRVVVLSPEHATEEFLRIVDGMGLHKVSYNVGWTNWLDIAPDGVNKSTALERVRGCLGIPRENVVAVGDGRNDIDMLAWAAEAGHGVAMGQAPEEVRAAANHLAGTDIDDGLARVLRDLVH